MSWLSCVFGQSSSLSVTSYPVLKVVRVVLGIKNHLVLYLDHCWYMYYNVGNINISWTRRLVQLRGSKTRPQAMERRTNDVICLGQ